jgi:hypothetical protein
VSRFQMVQRHDLLKKPIMRIARCFTFLTQLRRLSFHLSQREDNDGVRLVLQAMRHMESTHLASLTVYIDSIQDLSSYDFDSWFALGTLIDSPRFSRSLHELAFDFCDWGDAAKQSARARDTWVAEMFPLCAARGILQICH